MIDGQDLSDDSSDDISSGDDSSGDDSSGDSSGDGGGLVAEAKMAVCKKLAATIQKNGNSDGCGMIAEATADAICDAALGGPEDPVGDVACPVEVEDMCNGLAKYIENNSGNGPTSICQGFLSSDSSSDSSSD